MGQLAPYPGPLAAAKASSPMKKSKSSDPRFTDTFEAAPPPPPARNAGLLETAGLPPPGPDLVAIEVGKTKEGESLPANPSQRG